MGVCVSSQSNNDNYVLWHDRQIKWDISKQDLQCIPGETIVYSIDGVEDTKGDNALGNFIVTNLRVVWISSNNQKLNISLGFGNISYVHFNMCTSKFYGRIRASYLMTHYNNLRFEFTFAAKLSNDNLKLFNVISKFLSAYRASKIYRDLNLRDEHLVSEQSIALLPEEHLIRKIDPCENLTTDEAFMGSMYITNFRIAWCSSETPSINVSIPFIQVKSVSIKPSTRHGLALVIETSVLSGGYILGFRLNFDISSTNIIDMLQKLISEVRKRPYLGPIDGNIKIENGLVVSSNEGNIQSSVIQNNIALDMIINESRLVLEEKKRKNSTLRLPVEAVKRTLSKEPSRTKSERELNLRTTDLAHFNNLYVNNEKLSPQSKKYAESSPKCVICWINKDDVAFDPCGHLCTCLSCAQQLNECPICRVPIGKVLKIFLVST